MKNIFFILLAIVLFMPLLEAQSPQFAVVRPNGTTQIYPTWTSAYNAAVNDDFIYLPGMGLTGELTINKRLHIFGAGHHPDSTNATNKTIIAGNISIYSGANGGSIDGVTSTGNLYLGQNGTKVVNYTIQRCYITGTFTLGFSGDSMPEYITVSECILNAISSGSSNGTANSTIEKNIIRTNLLYFNYSLFKNNIFLYLAPCGSGIQNCTFENNIFTFNNPFPNGSNNCFNSFFNNLKVSNAIFESNANCPILAESGNISVSNYTDIFISYDNNGFDYDDDYHLKPTCPGVDAGTDGTDVGIYGTADPTSEGWVPSNPHIYFKDIAPTTGPDGKLHIEVGVRANN